MANNKVQLANGTVLIDITDTTANASDVLSGEYFYNASGVKTEGSLTIPSTYTVTKTLTNVTTHNNDTEVLAGGSFYMDLIPSTDYRIRHLTVTMGGIDITEQVFKAGVGDKNIIENGIYNAEDDWLEGYSSVNVNVPNTYSLSDEGKVVNNGELVSQTSSIVTNNGTVDTTLINSLEVNVSGSITPTGTKQINITQNGTVVEDITNYANVEIISNVTPPFPENFLLISSLFNSKYGNGYVRSGGLPTTSPTYSSGIVINCGTSRVQYGYVRIGLIDLTNINTLKGIYSLRGVTNASYFARIFISKNAVDYGYSVPTGQYASRYYTNSSTITENEITLDVSGFSGEYYIFVGTDSNGGSWSSNRIVTVHTISFE